ncbi:hypothetical protein RHMOL_Rhmol02G0245400 [Rhododendron molle]|uniref:Uncharacterized protein n=1 Tax=Rhododendron molle TaxID=49168 RepID=A0ACC0PVC1_RHOML|nr:hypothetical protein RHMOL_Rhmol02G0245400 [Rhododendron molle]
MADDKTTRSKLSEKDRKDTEDEKLRDTSKGKSKATTEAHENTEEEEATKKKLKIGVGDTKGGLERKTSKSVCGKEIANSSGVQIKSESEIQSETEMPMKTKFEQVKADAESFSEGEEVSLDLTKSDDSNRSVEEFAGKVHGSPGVTVEDYFKLESDMSDYVGAVTPETRGVISAENEDELKQTESGSSIYLDANTTFEGPGIEKKSTELDLKIDTNIEGLEEEFAGKVHGSPGVIVEDYFKLESDMSDDVGAVTPETRGVISADNEDELKQTESGSSIYLDANTTFEGLGIEKKSTGLDLKIDTNIVGLEEELARRAKKGKAKLEGEGNEADDYVEVETNVEGLDDEMYEVVRPPKIEGLAKEMRELYRQVTKGTKDKVNRLMKDPDESPSEGDEESESESESESERENCEMLLKTSLRLMLELDIEIRGLLEELEQQLQLLMFKVDEAGPKVLALRAEVEVLKESNYAKEVEVIGMVKGLMDGGATEAEVIDAVWKSEIGPMVEKAKEKIAQVKSERKEVDMDRNKSSDASEN